MQSYELTAYPEISSHNRTKPTCFRVGAILCQVFQGSRGNTSSDLSSPGYSEGDSSPVSHSPTTVPPIYKLVILSCFRTFCLKRACLIRLLTREKYAVVSVPPVSCSEKPHEMPCHMELQPRLPETSHEYRTQPHPLSRGTINFSTSTSLPLPS